MVPNFSRSNTVQCNSGLSKPVLRWAVLSTLQCASLLAVAASETIPQSIPVVSSHIQVLAASCAACHGNNGNSASVTPVLAGLDHDYFVLQMNAFRSGERTATVMQRHAKGLTSEEIEQLAIYFSQQQRKPSLSPPAQIMDPHHDE